LRFAELLPDRRAAIPPDLADRELLGLTADSRRVAEGFLFAALPGHRLDGRSFIGEAIGRGAIGVLALPGTRLPEHDRPVALIESEEPRRLLAQLAARLYQPHPRIVTAVTGTNGKTSTVTFARQIWAGLGTPAASLGTLGLQPPRADAPASLTTPDPVELARCLAGLAADGVEAVALEASSHGLDQYRLDGLTLSAAAFTNLSRDHLDYHGSMEAYFSAKARLFAELLPAGGTAVLNADVPEYAPLAEMARGRGQRLLGYGRAGGELRLQGLRAEPAGLSLALSLLGLEASVRLPVAGTFQAANLLAAIGLVLADRDVTPAAVLDVLPRLSGVPGRVERVGRSRRGGEVYVDYAHTPDALATVLAALRPHATGRLVVAFGAGGDRDPGKRPLMGQAATAGADLVIVTDDNPRSEDPAAIRAAVMAGAPGAREIGDRREAIVAAIGLLGAGDLLVIAGKGHEQGQIVGARVLPFDDRVVAREALQADGGAA